MFSNLTRRTLFTSPISLAKTIKRRKRYPFFWLQDKYRAYYDENLTPKNEEFFQQFLKDKYNLSQNTSPLKTEPWNLNETFTEGSARTGVIAKKLGTFPMWTNKCHVLVLGNHVFKYNLPHESARLGRPVDMKRHASSGAGSQDPQKSTAQSNESGVTPELTRSHQPIEDFLDLNVVQKENETYVEAVPIDTGREGKVVNAPASKHACVLCRLNLRGIDYTDVMILSQFIKRDGSIATYHESKLCSKQYRLVTNLIKKAQRCNLIKRPADYLVPGPWHDLNTYLEPNRYRDQPMKIIKKQYWRTL